MGYLLPSLRLYTFFFPLFISACCFITLINPTSSSGAGKPTELVKTICRNTTNYTFCVDSLYSDPRTSTAGAYVLAFISFDLAYLNATNTKSHIQALLNSSRHEYSQILKKCDGWYGEAVTALAQALNDLNSETYSDLALFAAVSDRKARDCEAAFRGRAATHDSPLSRMNRDLRGLSKICIVVSNLFTASS